jgi:hypothetical protein
MGRGNSPGEGNFSWARPWNRLGERDAQRMSGPWACNSVSVGFGFDFGIGFENSEEFFLPVCFTSFVTCKVIRVNSLIKFEPTYSFNQRINVINSYTSVHCVD